MGCWLLPRGACLNPGARGTNRVHTITEHGLINPEELQQVYLAMDEGATDRPGGGAIAADIRTPQGCWQRRKRGACKGNTRRRGLIGIRRGGIRQSG